MKSNLVIAATIFYLQISTLVITNQQICQYFVINKSNKCKLITYRGYSEDKLKCVCQDIQNLNIELNFSNSTIQSIQNVRRKYSGSGGFGIYFKNKKSIVFGKQYINIINQASKYLTKDDSKHLSFQNIKVNNGPNNF